MGVGDVCIVTLVSLCVCACVCVPVREPEGGPISQEF